jgi:Mg-chelatase subunit ChlD
MNTEVSEISVNNKLLKGLKIIGNPIAQRNATHTIVLLDTSGSMNDQSKLNNVKKSLSFLLKFLQKSDYLSLVTFNYGSQIIINNIKVSSEYLETFRYAIDTLDAEGGTNLSSGLLNVKSIVERADQTQVSKTGLIILTDGQVNEGIIRSEELMRIIHSIKEVNPNITITTIGYGEDHNAALLNNIATNSGGSYNVVNTIEEVGTVFGDILGGLMTTVAQNVQVTYPSSWNCINIYLKSSSNNTSSLYIGDVCAESETILLFENTDNEHVTLTGVLTNDYSSINNTISWSTNLSQSKDSYHMAYIRNTIAYILKNLRNMEETTISTNLNPIKEYLNQPLIQYHPLTNLLKSEIENIENQIRTPSQVNTTMNLQTSAFLALGRGTSSPRRLPRRRADSNDENMMLNAMNSISISTPFSNRIQRELTQQITSMAADPTND